MDYWCCCRFISRTFRPARISEFSKHRDINSLYIRLLRSTYFTKTHPDLKRGFRTPFVPVLPVVAILCCLYLMINLSKTTWISFAVWLIVGLCFYFFYSRKHSHLATEKRMMNRKSITK